MVVEKEGREGRDLQPQEQGLKVSIACTTHAYRNIKATTCTMASQ
jgi:hypothetical protein